MSTRFPNRWRYGGRRRPWQSITRENVIDWLRTLAWVVPLTLLIWIWAEREQLARTPSPVAIPIALRTASPNVVVHLKSPGDGNVMAELSGPSKSLDEVLKIIQNPIAANRVYINVDGNVQPGRYTLPADRIGQSTIFAGRGVSVVDASPPTLTYDVEKIVEANFPVELSSDITNLDGPATFDPPTVRFRGPQSVLDRLTADRETYVTADLSGRDALHIPGAHEEKAVPIQPPRQVSDQEVTFTPSTVTAVFKVRQTEEKFIYPSMPVWVLAPPVLADRGYKVVIVSNPNLANVTLLASPSLIAQLRNDTLTPKPRAHIDVSLDDLPSGTVRTRQVKYDLPEGVRVSADDLMRTVDFKLQEVTPKE
ncbi:MAG TPA: hypothetical protein VG722_02670 [Tepidisphaeraceae bacterium]|nr:hypothetical protein [Tepidisphaeraceae bacterium]